MTLGHAADPETAQLSQGTSWTENAFLVEQMATASSPVTRISSAESSFPFSAPTQWQNSMLAVGFIDLGVLAKREAKRELPHV